MDKSHRELMFQRMEQMGISKKDLFIREKEYLKVIHNKEYKDTLVNVEDLGLIQYWASNKRKIKNPTFVKIDKYCVFKYYINLGIVFRDKNKRYYTMEEVEEKIIILSKLENNIIKM